jgi:cell division septation protein DedD
MVENGGRTLIVSVLASSRLWDDVQELFRYGFSYGEPGEPRFVPIASTAALPSPLNPSAFERKSPERKPPDLKPAVQKSADIRGGTTSAFTVQVGAFREKKVAETMLHKLRQRGYSAYVTTSGTPAARWYRVRVGEFDSQGEAKRVVGRLKSQMGLKALIATPD